MKTSHFIPVLTVCFIAFIGISIPLPILTPLILAEPSIFFPLGTSLAMKKMFLGMALASYPLGEFVGSPILGTLSDKWGRKRMLIWGQIGTSIGQFITGYCIVNGLLYPLMIVRFMTGLCEGTVSIAQAYIADHAPNENKSKLFGMITAAISLGYVIGPIIGGVFSKISLSAPFTIVGIFGLLLSLGIKLYIQEDTPLKLESERPLSLKEKINIVMKNSTYKYLLIASTLASMGMTLYVEFFSGHLNQRWRWDIEELSLFWIYVSLVWGILSLFTQVGEMYLSAIKRGALCLCLGAIMLFLIPHVNITSMLILTIPLAFGLSIGPTILSVMISDSIDKDNQGIGLGIRNSVRVLGDAIVCLLGGPLFAYLFHMPFTIGSILILISIYFVYFAQKSKVVNSLLKT